MNIIRYKLQTSIALILSGRET